MKTLGRTFCRMSLSSPRPIIAVIGTTGVGKSQLAIALARSLAKTSSAFTKGVVLSADSMQLYKGLDVITNKVTAEEMDGVEHWGLDLVTPGQGGSWEVGKWCGEADKKLGNTSETTLPIICGGTHYFIQHFLFPPGELSFERTSTPTDPLDVRWKPPRPRPPIPSSLSAELENLLDTFWMPEPSWPKTNEAHAGPSRSRPTTTDDQNLLSLHTLLAAVDPEEAGRWHWRDGRKVKRGLERWWERGGGSVAQTSESTSTGRKARFKTLIFWVFEPLESLKPRLDRRVNKMVENGLLREIAEMRETALQMYGSTNTIDHTEGIFQSIGYKEFSELDLNDDPASDPKFPNMLAQTKLRTYQYARSQLKWIRKQLLPAVREARSLGGEVEVFAVPGGVAEPAEQVLKAFLDGNPLPHWKSMGHNDAHVLLDEVYSGKGEAKVPDTAARQVLNSRRDCNVCSLPGKPFSVSTSEWDDHQKSRVHQRALWRKQGGKEKEREEQMAMRDVRRAEREKLRQAKEADNIAAESC